MFDKPYKKFIPLLSSIVTLAMLACPLLIVDELELNFFGFSLLGFGGLGMRGYFTVMSYLELIVSIVLISLSIVAIVKKKAILPFVLMIVAPIFTAFYLLEGIALIGMYAAEKKDYTLHTFVYIPVIVQALLVFCYFFSPGKKKSQMPDEHPEEPVSEPSEPFEPQKRLNAEELFQLKELLDAGVINRDEYDKKKEELLK